MSHIANSGRRTWQPIVDASQQARICEIVYRVCRNLHEKGAVDSILANGLGVALAFEQMDRCFPGEGWGKLASGWIVRAMHEALQDGTALNFGLLDGLAGIAWITHYVAGKDPKAKRILARLDQLLARYTEAQVNKWNPLDDVVPVYAYDLISGIAGISLYLLERKDERSVSTSLVRSYDFLTSVVSSIERRQSKNIYPRPIVEDPQASKADRESWNLGLAHGLPGVLVALAKALQIGFQIPQLAGKVSFLARWLISVAQSDDWGMIWSAYYPHLASFSLEPYRTAWCYGSPGVARALWLAGQALGDLEIKQSAIHAIDACCRRPRERWQVTTAMFCHGPSGIVEILLRFYYDTGIKRFADFANLLVGDICNEFSIDLVYGFPNGRLSEEKQTQELLASENSWQDSSAAFLLQGSAGIVLVLLAASQQVYPDWDSIFGLS